MANRTAWTGGLLNAGLGWTSLFSSVDINLLSTTVSVRSSLADITNGTSLDQFMDISFAVAFSQATTLAVGASASIYIMPLLGDGTTYGDNSIPTAGTAGATTNTIGLMPAAVFNGRNQTSLTALIGFAQGIIIPPGSFRCALTNNVGFRFTGNAQTILFRSYNQNLNS